MQVFDFHVALAHFMDELWTVLSVLLNTYQSNLIHFVFFQDSLVFIVGKMDGLMVVSGRRHNADDVVATALAVEPMKFVYRGR